MVGIFVLDDLVHRIPHLTCTFLIHKVAHIDRTAVEELPIQVGIFHHATEQSCIFIFVAPVTIAVVVGVIQPFNRIIVSR